MKLTKAIKCEIATAIMRDIPRKITKNDLQLSLEKDAKKVVAGLPEKVALAWSDIEIRRWMSGTSVQITETCTYEERHQYREVISGITNLHKITASIPWNVVHLVREEFAASRDLFMKFLQQETERLEMERQLNANFSSCSTRKVFIERFPEFEKYLAAESVASPSYLPSTTNLIANLAKLGWAPSAAGDAGAAA